VSLSSRTTDATSDGTWPSSTTVGVLSDREMAASSAVLSSTGSWPPSSLSTCLRARAGLRAHRRRCLRTESCPPSSLSALSPTGGWPGLATELTGGVSTIREGGLVGLRACLDVASDRVGDKEPSGGVVSGRRAGHRVHPQRCLRPRGGLELADGVVSDRGVARTASDGQPPRAP
jgi:hypothetical protein